jgi:hypothetical protein
MHVDVTEAATERDLRYNRAVKIDFVSGFDGVSGEHGVFITTTGDPGCNAIGSSTQLVKDVSNVTGSELSG